MSKVILPKEVAEAIEKLWSIPGAENAVKHLMLTNWDYLAKNHSREYTTLKYYATDHPIEYMRALVEDYEVEKTPEDLVREYFKKQASCEKMNEDTSYFAIQKTLNFLGIKIEGVNK